MDCDLRIVVSLIQETYNFLVLVRSSEAHCTRGLGNEQRHRPQHLFESLVYNLKSNFYSFGGETTTSLDRTHITDLLRERKPHS